jgi:hypothetical protein
MLPGVDAEAIVNALVEGYNIGDLTMAVRYGLQQKLPNIVDVNKAFPVVVFDLLNWAEQRGLEGELIRVAYRYNSGNRQIQAAYQKYGMTPAVVVTQGTTVKVPATKPADDAGLERVVRPFLPMFDAALWREQMTRMESRICRVELNPNDPAAPRGTGFLVGPDAVLTNYHVMEPALKNTMPAANVRFRFDYKRLSNGTDSLGTAVALHADWDLDHSPYSLGENAGTPDDPPPTADELDFALVRLANPIGNDPIAPETQRGWVVLPAAAPPVPDESLFILQHPKGDPLQLALATQANLNFVHGGLRVRYDTTTEPGSSGAPCFSSQWGLLALHHYGDPDWRRQATYNQGIPIALIRARLEGKPAAAATLKE